MGINIGSNISSLQAQRRLGDASTRLDSIFERLSSGQRINKASDDAAGLAVSQNLKLDSRVFTQGIRNVSDGISLLSIASGALTELSNISSRQLELAEQASNGTYSLTQRKAMQTEANALVDEFNRITQTTKFNGISLLDASLITSGLRIQAGYQTSGSISFNLGSDLARQVGDGTFGSITSFSTIATQFSGSNSIATADFNNDNIEDIVSLDSGSTVSILLGNGDGSFRARLSITASGAGISVNTADVNNDGKVDILIGDNTGANLNVFIGNGNGFFQGARSYKVGATPNSISTGDLNEDGIIDVVVGTLSSNSISVLFGNSDGSFAAQTSLAAPANVRTTTIADFNNDGNLDIVTGSIGGTPQINIYIGNGNGTFNANITYLTTPLSPNSIAFGDFNRDGYLDLVAGNLSGGGFGGFSIFNGNGDGSFRRSVSYLPTSGLVSTRMIQVADFNGDGYSDVATVASSGNFGDIYIANSDGTFKSSKTFATSVGSSSFAVDDFNRDGVADIVLADAGAATTSVLLANTSSSTSTPYLYLLSQAGARDALNTVQSTLSRISSQQGAIGAIESRYKVAINTLQITNENTVAANSRITDADIATESSDLSSTKIRQQAAQSILAQANQIPALALILLR